MIPNCGVGQVWGDGNWVARWSVAVFHQSLFNNAAPNGVVSADHDIYSLLVVLKYLILQGTMAPVPVKTLKCDGDTYKCTADLVGTL